MTARLSFLALVLSIPLLAGCSPSAKLIGKWDLDTGEPEATTGGPTGGAYIPSALVGFMKPKMNIEFQQDRDLLVEAKMAGESAEARGKWKYVKTDSGTMILKVTMDGREEQELRVKFVDGNTIETVPPPVDKDDVWSEQTFTFKRRPF